MQKRPSIEELKEPIDAFLALNEPYHRNLSWDHCYKAFDNISKESDKDYLALHLAFYLASWGMYRGSSGLLWKDYKIHVDAIGIIEKYSWLRGNSYRKDEYLKGVLDLVEELSGYYENIKYKKTALTQQKLTPTSTLISKIILGTLGCLPAFDQYFCLGFWGKTNAQLIKKNIESIQGYAILNQSVIIQRYRDEYPVMKVIDMGFCEYGFKKHEEMKKQR